jgi:hypothetical protein
MTILVDTATEESSMVVVHQMKKKEVSQHWTTHSLLMAK